jgi:hypothetical protein
MAPSMTVRSSTRSQRNPSCGGRVPAVLIPYRAGCPHRARALDRVTSLYRQQHPDWPVVLGRCDEGPWVKALAIFDALSRTDADVLVVADADVWSDGIGEAAAAVEQGAKWAIPHWLVRRLAEDGSEQERPYPGIEGGGIVVLPRETLLETPPDPRFVGWGQEDESFGLALTVIHGSPWRGKADLLHFYHPPQPRLTRRRGSRESWDLRKRYFNARYQPGAMEALIGEARDALAAPEHAVRHHAQPAG